LSDGEQSNNVPIHQVNAHNEEVNPLADDQLLEEEI
jgi:hypothetical protein